MRLSDSDGADQNGVPAIDSSDVSLNLAAPPQTVQWSNPGFGFVPVDPFLAAFENKASAGAPSSQRTVAAPSSASAPSASAPLPASVDAPSASAPLTVNIVDVIPASDSAETDQNSETSLAVNPTDPNQIVLGAFTSNFVGAGVTTDFFDTTNAGASWSD